MNEYIEAGMEPIAKVVTYDGSQPMLDITEPTVPVEIQIRNDGRVLWINMGGRCVVRICRIGELVVTDARMESWMEEPLA